MDHRAGYVHRPVCHTSGSAGPAKGGYGTFLLFLKVVPASFILFIPETVVIKPKSSYTESSPELSIILLRNNIPVTPDGTCRDLTRLKDSSKARPASLALALRFLRKVIPSLSGMK